MPVRSDITVVNNASETTGINGAVNSGGRKLVRLKNGWLVTATINTGSPHMVNIYVSKDNGATFASLCYVQDNTGSNSVTYPEIVAKDNTVHLLAANNGHHIYYFKIDAETQTNVNIWSNRIGLQVSGGVYDSNYAALAPTMALNEAETEIHAAWQARNATYPYSFNIQYAKGTIGTNGSVSWGAVVQVTNYNVTYSDCQRPSIAVTGDGHPFIAFEWADTSGGFYSIDFRKFNGSGWNQSGMGSQSYIQLNPATLYVPSRINGLANGRLWVVCDGRRYSAYTGHNVRLKYSDDNGATWSSLVELTSIASSSEHRNNPTITSNQAGEVFVLYNYYASSVYYPVYQKWNGTSWGTETRIGSFTSTRNLAMSSVDNFDVLSMTTPMFIYTGSNKVGFYGTWTTLSINVNEGPIGAKSNRSSVLTYAITTDGAMSTITEKVNGTVVNTRSATSGQSITAGLTQAQWDAIKYGKYADATGGPNTFTIEMGTGKWTYTFDKRALTTDDVPTTLKALQDTQATYLPAVKAKFGSAMRARGSVVNDTDSFETMIGAISTVGKAWASGTVASGGSTSTFTASGLIFQPAHIIIEYKVWNTQWSSYDYYTLKYSAHANHVNTKAVNWNANPGMYNVTWNISNNGFTLNFSGLSTFEDLKWIAFE